MFRKTLLLTVIVLLLSIQPLLATDGKCIDFLLSGLSTLYGGTLNGGKVYSYSAGTSTAKAIYSNLACTTAYANPATLDTDGRLVAYGSGMYKFVIKDSLGTTIFTADNVEVNSLETLTEDTTDPFGATLTQTNLIVTNLTASNTTGVYLTVTGSATFNMLSMATSTINDVASGVLDTDAVNLLQLKDFVKPRCRYHQIATFTLTASDTWTDLTFDTSPASSTTTEFSIATATTITTTASGQYEIGGTLNFLWNGADDTNVLAAGRVLYSTNSGSTWTEVDGLQVSTTNIEKASNTRSLAYRGLLNTKANTWLKLQAYASGTQMLLVGNASFTNDIAYTFQMHRTGSYIE